LGKGWWSRKRSQSYQVITNVDNQDVKLSISADGDERLQGRSTSFTKTMTIETFEDEDVIEERRRIANGDVPATAQVIINDIRKDYEVPLSASFFLGSSSLLMIEPSFPGKIWPAKKECHQGCLIFYR